jgi:hypothetical protein
LRALHSGSALAFQARGAGSIPAARSGFYLIFYVFLMYNPDTCEIQVINMADVAKWSRQWTVTPPFAGSTPVIRQLIILRYEKQIRSSELYSIETKLVTRDKRSLKLILLPEFFRCNS